MDPWAWSVARIGKIWPGIHHSCTPFGGAPDLRRPRGESPAPPPFCMELSPCRNEVVPFISVCMHFRILAYLHTSRYAYNANWGAFTTTTTTRTNNNECKMEARCGRIAGVVDA